jgi:hypothetical protein
LAADNPPQGWRRGNESHPWLKLAESVSTSIDQGSEQLCSKQAEGRAVMDLTADLSALTEPEIEEIAKKHIRAVPTPV